MTFPICKCAAYGSRRLAESSIKFENQPLFVVYYELQPISKTFFHSMSMRYSSMGIEQTVAHIVEAKKCYFPEMVRPYFFLPIMTATTFDLLFIFNAVAERFQSFICERSSCSRFHLPLTRLRRRKINFAQARSTQRCGTIILWRVRVWTEVARTQQKSHSSALSFLDFHQHSSRLIFNMYSDRNLPFFFSAEI